VARNSRSFNKAILTSRSNGRAPSHRQECIASDYDQEMNNEQVTTTSRSSENRVSVPINDHQSESRKRAEKISRSPTFKYGEDPI
jgi:hypothetical protein